MLGYASQGLTDLEQKKVIMKTTRSQVMAIGHMLESVENLGTLQSPRARCPCRSIYSKKSMVLLQCHNCSNYLPHQ
jgi:hypothetical protein